MNEMVRRSLIVAMVIPVMVMITGYWSHAGVSEREETAMGTKWLSDHAAQRAYELRMQGKIDEAGTLLEQAISEKPDNSAAHYELARVQLHRALGSGSRDALTDMVGDARDTIDRAVSLTPEDVNSAVFAGYLGYLQAYTALMMGGKPREKLVAATSAFDSALRLKPGHHPVVLYLIELYGQFPAEAGGDRSMAEKYAKQLEAAGGVAGAKARSILLPEDVDRVDYWQKVLRENQGNPEVLEELGKAYLGANKLEDALSCFQKAIGIDSAKASLFLDLSIYHTFRAMGAGPDKDLLRASVASGDAAIARYIASEPIQPMLAYALGVQAKYKFFLGDQEQGQALFRRAEMLDPYFSKATAAPHPGLFHPPGEISDRHRYLMRPF